MRVIQILPQAVGWTVQGWGEPQFFHSGGQAEQAGRRLAAALAEASGAAELRVADRSGRLVGRLRFHGQAAGVWELSAGFARRAGFEAA